MSTKIVLVKPDSTTTQETAKLSVLHFQTRESHFQIKPVRPPSSIHSRLALSQNWYLGCKGIVEWLLALVLFVLALPVILVCALLVRLTSSGAAFYSQTRLGRHGMPFRIYKLRTMVDDCEKRSGAQWSRPGDPRVTAIGRILRKIHLDELPQLWNVLRGDMGLVGPRPERPEFIPSLEKALPHYCDRLLIKPGITGLAQVQLPPDTDLNSVRRKLAFDLLYIRNVHFSLDLRLIACTALHMIGVPYRWLTVLFVLPRLEVAERAYQRQVKKDRHPLESSIVTGGDGAFS